VTKLAGTNYDPNAQCAEWLTYLKKVTGEDEELRKYLQRIAGYILTGLVDEEVAFFLWGEANGGKTTFRETLFELMGDYATASDSSLLVDLQRRDGSSPTPNLVRLHGCRLVTLNETPENSLLNEARLKFITGHDHITARDLYESPFDFYPTHKTMVTTNHKPIVRDLDESVWRRLDLLPFEIEIPASERVKDYRTLKLVPEHPGILNWALEGLREYLKIGRSPPLSVTAATAAYREDMDLVRLWIDECCVRDLQAETPTSWLYDNYKRWAENDGLRPMSKVAFGRALSHKRYKLTAVKIGRSCTRGFRGLKLKPYQASPKEEGPPSGFKVGDGGFPF
jgi:putative DNA primase/helicase